MPDWLAQRIWSALLIVAACEGARRLARALGLGGPRAALLAGMAFAFSPRLLGLSGALTGEILPTVVLPWTCLPLVLACGAGWLPGPPDCSPVPPCSSWAGSTRSRTSPLCSSRCAWCSAAPGRPPAAACWPGGAVATSLAALWWMAPLVVMGRYSPPFLDYIETAAATTAVTAVW